MNRHDLDAALSRIGRLAAPAFVAAVLAAGPALAQSSTTIITDQPPATESSKTTVETHTNDMGDTVEKRKTVTEHEDGSVTKEVNKTHVDEAPSTSTTVIER
ncbi:hypothetical protein ACFQI3_13455 [Hansschlegelia quercus]|uniref:Uncharacterized protein n=1 Tax=Hansschlegelia quercus TaxID=2528245 RepID=A0A4V2JDB6_9HYPH|nr:hypothetical protein [Hansschlegelia quercus]TBN47942.1 hypothetical protein EYR15_15090 [Hansschlegelia quercus]